MDKRIVVGGGAALLALALAGGGYQFWRQRHAAPVVAAAPAAEPEPAASAPAAAPAIRYPIDSMPGLPAADAPPPATGEHAAIKTALDDLLGAKTVLSFLQVDGVIGRFVATVDNLDREFATPRLWPVNPTPGRFGTQRTEAGETVAAANAARYQPFVRFVEGIDTPRAVALYVRFYPSFQQAYAALGYPRGYFNDRLVGVIDKLLDAPMATAPVALKLVEVKGPVESTRPWTRYEFADPAFEALPIGQKIMLRMGRDNELRLKAKLAEFRRALAAGAMPRQ